MPEAAMLLNNEFIVDTTPERAWDLLTDLERVAACIPGAQLDGRDDDTYRGTVRIKVGPVAATFEGTAHFVDRDRSGRVATIAASGTDRRGQAGVGATIQVRLVPEEDRRTRVLVDTDLPITGR